MDGTSDRWAQLVLLPVGCVDVSGLASTVTQAPPRLLFLITEDWYFWSHRLDLVRAAAQAGFDVSIATRVTDYGERIQREVFRLFQISLFRRSRNLLLDFA